MGEGPQPALRVALMAEEGERGEFLALLAGEGIEVVLAKDFAFPLPDVWNGAEVLLVGMSDQPDLYRVHDVLQQSPVPVLLSQGGIGRSEIWHRRLIGKLQTLADRAVPSAHLDMETSRPDLRVVRHESDGRVEAPRMIVLGASIGGPKAVARFLRALPENLPVTFLLAQHISEDYQDLLVEQLDRCSGWPVALLGNDQTVEAGQVWLIPAENKIVMDAKGRVRRCGKAWESAHRPDINAVLSDVAETFGARCGAILFSGLGEDGTRGCETVSRHGGFVWAQSSESCVISNLPEAARRSCKVELSGNPEELAQALVTCCQTESTSIN